MTIDRYAVMGNPIKHSKSPQIHKAFADQTDQRMTYTSMLVPADDFETTVRQFFAEEGQGLNITLPFKLRAFDLADELTERARRAKAVNTLWQHDGKIVGDNTDGVGLQALRNQGEPSEPIAVFGGGGTLGPLRSVFPDAEFISARTGIPRDHEGAPTSPKTLVLAGQGELPDNWKPETLIDLSYTENSQGLEFALRFGSRYINGLAMFKAQAQEQREFWKPLLESD